MYEINPIVKMNMDTLVSSMVSRQKVALSGTIVGTDICTTVLGVVNGIEVEDGSGRNYHVTLWDGCTIFVKADTLGVCYLMA